MGITLTTIALIILAVAYRNEHLYRMDRVSSKIKEKYKDEKDV